MRKYFARKVESRVRSYASVKGAFHAPLAQSVEHAAVNRSVVGSSPTRGAIANMATHR